MAIDISGLNFFMPVFSFLFVFIIVYAILFSTKIMGDSKLVLSLMSFIMTIIFMSVSSLDLYVRTIIPWAAVLLAVVFLVLLVGGLAAGKLEVITKSWFAWIFVVILIIIFLIAAIKVFNPVLNPNLGVTSGEGTSLLQQIKDNLSSGILGSILLLIIAGVVAWLITKK